MTSLEDIDRICDQYERTRQTEGLRSLQPYLDQIDDSARYQLLRELIAVDLEYASRNNETVGVTYYGLSRDDDKSTAEDILRAIVENETVDQSKGNADTASGQPDDKRLATEEATLIQKLGDYEIIEEIARGGMGVVFKARQVHLSRLVALKLILSGNLASEEEVRRFYTEATSAGCLEHPNIVPIYECGESEGRHYFSMAYVEGQSLAQRMRSVPLTAREIAVLLLKISKAVHYAHKRGIIHRDLKPSNVLIDQKGEPRVTDFGLAKSIQADSGLTATGQILGTPSYMPPEQALGRTELIRPASDVYSLGAILYELLTGRPPFRAATVVLTLRQVVELPVTPPRRIDSSVDKDLETIALKCLEKISYQRYSDAGEVADELERYLDGRSINARPIGLPTKLYRWTRRHPLTVALISTFLLLSVVSVFGWQKMSESIAATKLAELERQFRQGLIAIDAEPEQFSDLNKLVEQIRAHNPKGAEECFEELCSAYADRIRKRMKLARLTERDIVQLDIIVDEFAEFSPRRAQDLEEHLLPLRSEWLIVSDWPSTPAAFLQAESSVETADASDLPNPFTTASALTNAEKRIVRSRDAAQGNLRVTTRLDSTSSTIPSFTTGFVFSDGKRYGFRLVRKADYPTNEPKNTKTPDYEIQLLKDDLVLSAHLVLPKFLKNDVIELQAKREGEYLSVEIGGQLVHRFYDPFPLHREEPAECYIEFASQLPLKSVRFESQEPKIRTQLDRADQLLIDNRHEEALRLYAQEETQSDQQLVLHECRYKRGFCLSQMGRWSDAERIFAELLAESESQWGSLAGIRLWIRQLQDDRMSEADETYKLLAGRLSPGDLAVMVTQEERLEIIDRYAESVQRMDMIHQLSKQRIEQICRVAEMDRSLDPNGIGTYDLQDAAVLSHAFDRQVDTAFELAIRVFKDFDNPRILAKLVRLGQEAQRSEEVVSLLSRRLNGSPLGETMDLACRTALIRAHFGLGTKGKAHSLLMRSLSDYPPDKYPHLRTPLRLMQGFCHFDSGDIDQACQIWAVGYAETRAILDDQSLYGSTSTTPLRVVAMGVLSNSISNEDLDKYFRWLVASAGESEMSFLIQRVFSEEELRSTIKDLWSTDYGIAIARDSAFGTEMGETRFRRPLVAFGMALLERQGMKRKGTSQERIVLEKLLNDLYDAVLVTRTIGQTKVIQLGMTWNGVLNFLGWQGIEGALPEHLRGPVTYFAGYRMLTLGNPTAAQTFWESSVTDGSSARVKEMADRALQLLRDGEGELSVSHTGLTRFSLLARNASGEDTRIEFPEQKSVQLKPGEYSIECESDEGDIYISQKRITVVPASRHEINAWSRSSAGPVRKTGGILPAPAILPGLGTWNVVTRYPSSAGIIRWSPDGTKIAHADRGAVIRIFDATSDQLLTVLVSHDNSIRDLAWSPDSNSLLSCDESGKVILWSDGTSMAQFQGRTPVFSVAFLSSEEFIFSENATVFRIDRDAGELQRISVSEAYLRVVQPAPDMDMLAGGTFKGELILWQGQSWDQATRVKTPYTTIQDLVWSKDRRQIYLCGRGNGADKFVYAYDLDDSELRKLDCFRYPPVDLEVHPTSGWLTANSSFGYVELCDTEQNRIVGALDTSGGRPEISWAPDGKHVIDSGLTRFGWDGEQLTSSQESREIAPLVDAAVNSHTGDVALGTRTGQLVVLDGNGILSEPHLGKRNSLRMLKWSPKGDYLAALSYNAIEFHSRDGSGWTNNPKTHPCRGSLNVAWSPSAEEIALGCNDGTCFIISHPFDGEIVPLSGDWKTPATWISWDSNGQFVATAHEPGDKIVFHQRRDEKVSSSSQIAKHRVRGLRPGNSAGIVGITTDRELVLIDPDQSVQVLATINDLGGGPRHLVSSLDNSTFAITDWKGRTALLNSRGQRLDSIDCLPACAVEADFFSDQDRMLLLLEDGSARVFDREKRMITRVFAPVRSGLCEFSPHGQLIAHSPALDLDDIVYIAEGAAGEQMLLSEKEFELRVKRSCVRDE